MCGIFGIFGKNIDVKKAEEEFSKIIHRGKDAIGKIVVPDKILFHCLHAVVNHVNQPITSNASLFMANCEIYNWKEVAAKYNFTARNDAELIFLLLEKEGIAVLDELDGGYAFFYQKGNGVYLGRDLIGEKPLCYVFTEDVFAFASEAKALEGYGAVQHLAPTQSLLYNIKKHILKSTERNFFSLPSETKQNKETILKELETKLLSAVKKRIEALDHFGILFSGGIDSTVLAFLCKTLGKKFTCYTAAFHDGNTREAPDLLQAQAVAKELCFPLKTIVLDLEQTETAVKKVVRIIETTDVMKVGVALPFYFAAQEAHGQRVLISGLGSEELFAGYQRHLDIVNSGNYVKLQNGIHGIDNSAICNIISGINNIWKKKGNVNEECLRGLSQLWERDLYRDDLVTMAQTIELRLPFLDHDLIRFALSIPASYKITTEQNKIILRELAVRLGIPEEIAQRKKIAAQYGSNFDKALEKLAKKAGCKTKKEYLENL